jgi:thiol reductant ABC exporter CydC subunit
VPPFAVALLAGGATVALLWWLLPAAGLVVLVALALAATVVPWLTGRLARRAEAGRARARGDLTTAVVELLEGAPELLVSGALDRRLAAIAALDARLTRKATAHARIAGTGIGLTTLLTGFALWAVLVVAIEPLDPVTLAVVALVPLATFELVAGLPTAAQLLTHVRESAARVREVFEAEPPCHEPARPQPLPEARTLRVRGLRAPYGLHGIDLDLAPGRKVAVVGPSGAGKSTLAAVLLRFLDYDGSVTLGGTELRDLDSDAVRTVVGLVAQDAHVFDTTLHENVRLARRDASEAELREALARARALEWIDSLPDGLETEAGRWLSGGERRRIALARAELAAFELLVLDEPGEHLDVATADAIVADALDSDRGTLLITHRLAGLEAMDEIVVLDAGRVVERGTHAELVRRGGRYAESWTRARNTR